MTKWNRIPGSSIPYAFLHDHFPYSERDKISEKDRHVQNRIYLMKDDCNSEEKMKALTIIANELVNFLLRFNYKNKSDFVFLCAPTSRTRSYERRYRLLSEFVQRYTGIFNATPFVVMLFDRPKRHTLNKKERKSLPINFYLKKKYFEGKNVIVFDDVMTTGSSIIEINKQVIASNASIAFCVFYAKSTRFNVVN